MDALKNVRKIDVIASRKQHGESTGEMFSENACDLAVRFICAMEKVGDFRCDPHRIIDKQGKY